jgi:hypothetical protein
MTLSYSRDPFCCLSPPRSWARSGTATGGHRPLRRRAGGDRLRPDKMVIRRHVGRGQVTPLHPEAVAFAAHYGLVICWLLPAGPRRRGG